MQTQGIQPNAKLTQDTQVEKKKEGSSPEENRFKPQNLKIFRADAKPALKQVPG